MNRSFVGDNKDLIQRHGHLVEGVKHFSGDERLTMLEQNRLAILLDNAEREAKMRNRNNEAQTGTAAGVAFVTNQLPLIRKVYPSMITRELVSIQPMPQPTMKIFYYDVQRDDATSLSTAVHTQRTYANNVEYDPDAPTAIKEIVLKITDTDVSATEKKLKAKWTEEAYQDIMAYHGINVETDLTAALATEITREWDRVVLQAMFDGATGGAATFDQTVPAGITYTDRKVWMEGLYEKMIDVDTAIFKKRYRKTNWLVVPADIAGFIEKMAGFRADTVAANAQVIATGGRYFMGTLNNRWRVYVDPFITSDKILMGFNDSSNWMDTSTVFCPYVLAYFSDKFTDPNTFQSVKAIMSRAALKVVVPDLLGIVSISGS